MLNPCRNLASVVLLAAVTACDSGAAPPVRPSPAPTNPTGSDSADVPVPRGTVTSSPYDPLDHRRYSLVDPNSIWVVVNKGRPMRPMRYRPELALVQGYQVHPKVVPALEDLLAAAHEAGVGLRIMSAFRSYEYQQGLHERAVAQHGVETAEQVSARPGHSEHQTGLAIDFGSEVNTGCNLAPCFAHTPEGRWLRTHATRFGFILRYPRGHKAITGYAAEAWHYRFVGRALATEMAGRGILTLEDFFGIPGRDYPAPEH